MGMIVANEVFVLWVFANAYFHKQIKELRWGSISRLHNLMLLSWLPQNIVYSNLIYKSNRIKGSDLTETMAIGALCVWLSLPKTTQFYCP